MQTAIYIAMILVSAALTIIVVLQARSAGMQNRDTGSVQRTRRGLERTLYQATVVLASVFLLLALLASLPLFTTVPASLPAS